MTPQQEVEQFERKRGRRFTPKQRQEILRSLGIGIGIGLGVNSGENFGSGPSSPLATLGALAWWIRADNVLTATGVSQMTDLSGNNRHFTQGTGSAQPALTASAINGQPAVTSDGVNDYMTATCARVAPGTQPFYVWLVMKQIAWTGGFIGDFGATGFMLRPNGGVSPQLQQYNGVYTNLNGGATLGSFFRVEAQFSNTVSDYFKIGSTVAASGTSASNGAGSGTFSLFSFIPGAGFGQFSVADAFMFLGTPTGPQRSALDAYCTGRYGSGLV